jgi:PPOX class probable F420-dependent enzyme
VGIRAATESPGGTMPITIDTSTEFGAQVARRLNDDRIGWVTTMRPDGTPQPAPIWFHWDGETFLVMSEPTSRRVYNLAANPKASLHFNCDDDGGNVVVFTGEAKTSTTMPPKERLDAYFTKYEAGLKQIEMTREDLLKTYSTAIYLTPVRVTGH